MNHSVRKMCRSQATMERPCVKLILTFYCGMLFIQKNVESASPGRLFVIGDSYVDTGNLNKTNPNWKPPYGISFPGKPSGRDSDGKVLTDFIASAFNIPTPVPYNQRDSYPVQQLCFGMNFAVGGSGVFETLPGLSSMTTQIDQLQRLMVNGIYSEKDIEFSLLLFAVSGNDYVFYILQQKPIEGLPSFVESVIKQLAADLVRLYNMGFRRFALTDMEPLGCWPFFTADNSYRSCNATINTISLSHNILLRETVEGIRKNRADAIFVILDQYSDFMAIFQRPTHYGKFKEPLTPCCTGQCCFTDSAGKALYSVCAHPESAFFWDIAHPTQAGWYALTKRFRSSLGIFQN